MFIYWDCKILSGTATFHKRGVLDCNFQNPSEIPGISRHFLMQLHAPFTVSMRPMGFVAQAYKTGIFNTLCYVYNYGYSLASIEHRSI